MLDGIFREQFLRIFTSTLLFSLIPIWYHSSILPLWLQTGFCSFLDFFLEFELWLLRPFGVPPNSPYLVHSVPAGPAGVAFKSQKGRTFLNMVIGKERDTKNKNTNLWAYSNHSFKGPSCCETIKTQLNLLNIFKGYRKPRGWDRKIK